MIPQNAPELTLVVNYDNLHMTTPLPRGKHPMQDTTRRLPHLSEAILDNAVTTFIETLPIPIPDTPDNRAERVAYAIEAFVALNPANAADAALAQLIVVAEITAAWCKQRIMLPDITPDLARRFARQAESMLKYARTSRRMMFKSKPPPPQLSPAAPNTQDKRAAAANAERAARIRALDLRLIVTPPTMH
jgi:hypothetical protein